MRNDLTIIDLFSGSGGGSVGFARAGFRSVAAVELDRDAAEAYAANVGVAPIVRDIRKVTGTQLLTEAGLRRGQCTLIFGCPPCQSFTILRRGRRASKADARRNSLPDEYLRLIDDVNPRFVAFENVPGMVSPRWSAYFTSFLDELEDLGYVHAWAIVDAANYGVPQRRKRLLVVASRVIDPTLPKATHSPDGSLGLAPHITVREAIGDLPELDPGEVDPRDRFHRARSHGRLALERLRAIPEGGDRRDLPRRLQLDCHKDHDGHFDIYGRMSWDTVAPTLTSGCTNVTRGRFAHPDQDRAITLREAMRLQTLPDDTTLVGTTDAMALQVGNAVPTRLAERIGRHIARLDAAARGAGGQTTRLSKARVPIRSRA